MEKVDSMIPSYSVRESKKAKRVIIKVLAGTGLEIVVPKGFDRSKVPAILSQKREWIQSRLKRLSERGCLNEASTMLPTRVEMQGVQKRFEIQYCQPVEEGRVRLVETDACALKLTGNWEGCPEGCRKLLREWLKRKGREYLVARLHQVSDQTRLHFKKAQVRLQKSRWGSCSGKGTISLNAKLLFLPPELVRYILVHELCHTVHMNHSKTYWALISQWEPHYKKLDGAMRYAGKYVPHWAQ